MCVERNAGSLTTIFSRLLRKGLSHWDDEYSVTVAQDQETRIRELVDKLDAALREIKILREENALLKQRFFGRKSERLAAGQLDLFRQGETPVPVEPLSEEAPSKPRPKRKGHGRERIPEHLPRNVIELDVPEQERVCSCCGEAMGRIGTDVTERLRLIPARLLVDRIERPKYGCPQGHEIKTAELPAGVIDGGKYDASIYARVAVAKYQDHLPLNRLEGIFKRYGIKLPRQTMWDMLVRVDELVAQPVLEAMRQELLEEEILHADETPVTMKLEEGKGTKTAWIFGWRSLREEERSKALVEFRLGRGREGPLRFLGDWTGTLIVDGYQGYSAVCERNGIRRAGCWAHARRYFRQALDGGSREALGVLREIGRLFRVDREVKNRGERLGWDRERRIEERGKRRARWSGRLLDRIYREAERLDSAKTTLPGSKLGKAVRYLFGQRDALEVFREDARIPLHNNDQEQDLRHVAVGRKNWCAGQSSVKEDRYSHVA
ncbi:MAG TPA: IS66 family transposase [Planctomycetes bacterium]|nr:IS66 family transposase [Planctomycetota bacterium]